MNAEATSVRAARRIGAAIPGSWPAPPSEAAVGAAARLMLVPLRMLATSMGRRVAAATVLSVALVALVASLYASAEGGVANPAVRATPVAAAKPAAAAQPTAAAAAPAAARPEDAATTWFARQQRVPADRVRALQRQQVSATVTKVLVLAQVSPSDMPTAFVTVRRDRAGWKVS
jgi:hypothetical protein